MSVDNLEFNFILVTPAEYAKATGASYNETLSFCKSGQLEAYKTDGGQWKIKVCKDDVISKKDYQEMFEELNRYRGMIEAVAKLITA